MSIKLKTGMLKTNVDGTLKDLNLLVGDTATNINAINSAGNTVLTKMQNKYNEMIIPESSTTLSNKILNYVTEKTKATSDTKVAYTIDADEYSLATSEELESLKNDIVDLSLNVYHDKKYTISSAGRYIFPFTIKANKTYLVSNLATSGACTVNTANDDTADIEYIGSLNAGTNDKVFTATSNAEYIRGYANASSIIYIYEVGTKIDVLENEIDKISTSQEINASQNSAWIYFNDLSISNGDDFYVEATKTSGTATDVLLYANTTDASNQIGTLTFGNRLTITANKEITKVIGYIREFSSATINAKITIPSISERFDNRMDSAEDEINTIKNNVSDLNEVSNAVYHAKTYNASSGRYYFPFNIEAGKTYLVKNLATSGACTAYTANNNTADVESIGTLNASANAISFTATQNTTHIRGYANASAVINIYETGTKVDVLDGKVKTLEDDVSKIKENIVELPSYATDMVTSISNKLEGYQNSKSASIAFITDIHVAGDTDSDATQYAMQVSVNALNDIASKNPIDFTMIGGDYIYNATTQTKSATLAWYKKLSGTIKKINTPFFIGKGNHDVNDIARTTQEYLTDEELYKCMLKYSKGCVTEYGYAEKAYGYYDIPNKKIRCIFVNTLDNPFVIENGYIKYTQQFVSGVGKEQINFIANALKFTESGWGVIFFSHHALQNGTGINPSGGQDEYLNMDTGGSQLLSVINAYKNKSSYSNHVSSGAFEYNVDVDYTGNNSSEIIAMINGHSHADRNDVVNNILMISTMASSFIYRSADKDGNIVTRTAKTASETSWDIYTVDRLNKKIYVTRYGAGSDREFSY